MMLAHLGHADAALAVERAIAGVVLRRELLTPDMGGKATTEALGKAIADWILQEKDFAP